MKTREKNPIHPCLILKHGQENAFQTTLQSQRDSENAHAWILETRLVSAVCSFSLGFKSWFLFTNACNVSTNVLYSLLTKYV